MRRRRLIDAHNVMHKIGAIAERLSVNHSDAYSHFAAMVAGAGRLDKLGSTIVFDGPKVPVNPAGTGVTILFSHPRTADEHILGMVRQKDARGRWIVVTDDQEILDGCRINGVATQRTLDFIALLDKAAGLGTGSGSGTDIGSGSGSESISRSGSGSGFGSGLGSGSGSGSGSRSGSGNVKQPGQPDPGENPHLRVRPAEVDELLRLFREGSNEA